jgi:hypothetical protein
MGVQLSSSADHLTAKEGSAVELVIANVNAFVREGSCGLYVRKFAPCIVGKSEVLASSPGTRRARRQLEEARDPASHVPLAAFVGISSRQTSFHLLLSIGPYLPPVEPVTFNCFEHVNIA